MSCDQFGGRVYAIALANRNGPCNMAGKVPPGKEYIKSIAPSLFIVDLENVLN